MIVDLRTISKIHRHFHYTLRLDWWQGNDQYDEILGLDCPLRVKVSIWREGGKFMFSGELAGEIRIQCARCLEPYSSHLETKFTSCLASAPSNASQGDVGLLAKDMLIDFITGDEIDLDEMVREQIYLSVPMKPLCRRDCGGLCPMCGANLNRQACTCQQELGHPGFSILKQLKRKGE